MNTNMNEYVLGGRFKPSIIFEDNHLLIVEKPVNVPSQADDTADPDLLSLLKEDIKIRYNKPGQVYLGLVHRLDRPVGGIMVFAKTSKAASRLSDAVRTRSLKKQYLAVTNGAPKHNTGTLEHYLWKDTSTNIVKVVTQNHPGAKDARLYYEVLQHNSSHSLLQIDLHTGRPHQIRVQLSTIVCPIVGDQKYGQAYSKSGQQIALWSHCLAFEHPVKKEWMEFKSFPPREFPWDLWQLS